MRNLNDLGDFHNFQNGGTLPRCFGGRQKTDSFPPPSGSLACSIYPTNQPTVESIDKDEQANGSDDGVLLDECCWRDSKIDN